MKSLAPRIGRHTLRLPSRTTILVATLLLVIGCLAYFLRLVLVPAVLSMVESTTTRQAVDKAIGSLPPSTSFGLDTSRNIELNTSCDNVDLLSISPPWAMRLDCYGSTQAELVADPIVSQDGLSTSIAAYVRIAQSAGWRTTAEPAIGQDGSRAYARLARVVGSYRCEANIVISRSATSVVAAGTTSVVTCDRELYFFPTRSRMPSTP